MILNFKIDRQKITRLDDNFVVARSKNYLYAEFEFTDDWTGDIFAIFKNSNLIKPYSQKLVDNKCIVPWEVLQPGTLTVSAFGGDLVTANNVAVKIHDTGYDENAAESMTPTLEVYQQVIQEMIEKVSENEDVKANTASRHSHDNKSVIDTITEDMIKKWNAKENASNKTKVIDSNSTDEQYPTARSVIEAIKKYGGGSAEDVHVISVEIAWDENQLSDAVVGDITEISGKIESGYLPIILYSDTIYIGKTYIRDNTIRIEAQGELIFNIDMDTGNVIVNLLPMNPSLGDFLTKDEAYTKNEIDTMIGDIETALDEIIEIQNTLIGGETA